MFCSRCGKEIADGVRFCPGCGADTSVGGHIRNAANDTVESAARELGNAVQNVKMTYSGNANIRVPNCGGYRLQTDRSLFMYLILSIVTCGIYSLYFVYKMANDVNIACNEDGDATPGLAMYIILSLVTCGIYNLIWKYKLGNRLAANAPRYGMNFIENGTSVLLWHLFGAVLCGIGPFFAMNILIKNTNRICAGYNEAHGL